MPGKPYHGQADFLNRLMSRVNKQADSGCWIWTAAVAGDGRPTTWHPYQRRTVAAARALYELTSGDVELTGLCLISTCGNTYCVNPDHRMPIRRKDIKHAKV